MPHAPGQELRRLWSSLRFHLHQGGLGHVADEVLDLGKSSIAYPFAKRSRAGRTFALCGREFPYVLHPHNRAWRNERTVELSLARDFLSGTTPGRTLEIGNVLSHYWQVDHDVLDKYERALGVLNLDVVDFVPSTLYDRVLCISTLEHVGWDELPREPEKVLRAYRNIRGLVRQGGSILVTCPLGQNPYLDEYLRAGELDFPLQMYLRRVSADNVWEQCSADSVEGARYGHPYRNANVLFVGVVPGTDGWPHKALSARP